MFSSNVLKCVFSSFLTMVSFSALGATFDFTKEYNGHEKLDSIEYNAGGINLSVSAYSATVWETFGKRDELVGSYDSGLGATGPHTGSPYHALNNDFQWGQIDSLLLTFDQSVSLDAFSIGWSHNDSDMGLLAYTGSGDHNIEKDFWWTLESSGWDYIDSYPDVTLDSLQDTNNQNVLSKYWLISAHNSIFGNTDWQEDFVKLSSVVVSLPPSEVPIPGAMILFGVGLFGFGLIRRRK